jgi:hypothetical protein
MSDPFGIPHHPPPPNRSWWVKWRAPILIAAIAAVAAVGLRAAREHRDADLPVVVVFETVGSASGATVTISTAGAQSQDDVVVPGSTVRVLTPGAPVGMSVQGTGDGTVGCRIKVGAVVVASSDSTARFGVATCRAVP